MPSIPSLKQHLESKTNGMMILLLLAVISLACIGKLTQEAVDAIKWLGGSFFAVRGVANYRETTSTTEVESK